MELVADTNIIAAAILRAGVTRNLIFRTDIILFSPEYVSKELEKHEKEFLQKSGLSKEEYESATSIVLLNLNQLPHNEYLKFEKESKKLSPDPYDWPFFAVAISKKCAIWSNDSMLKKQTEIQIYTTKELLEILTKRQ
ncbi:hypothetical protein HY570_01205 [Candidatus Micrarchaeota archaeon]|nr:hypothetical protein [Candidatus Micrarchaeota archaeon]